MADAATLEARLAEAEEELHLLSTGKKEVSIGRDGKSVTYKQVRIGELRQYIADLKRQLGRPSGRRAITPLFGG